MVIPYRNKFLIVFSLSIVLELIPVIYSIALLGALNSDKSEGFLFNSSIPLLLIPVILVAGGLNLWSCYLLAKAKGYSGWSALIGFLNIFGLAVLFLLPDKQKEQPQMRDFEYQPTSINNQTQPQQFGNTPENK